MSTHNIRFHGEIRKILTSGLTPLNKIAAIPVCGKK